MGTDFSRVQIPAGRQGGFVVVVLITATRIPAKLVSRPGSNIFAMVMLIRDGPRIHHPFFLAASFMAFTASSRLT